MDSVDVRSPETVSQFEDMLSAGPITIVLVYADWCGHCTKFKENVWSKLMKTPNRKVNLASVHYDQLENTSQKNASIKGYPSVLIVGSDKKAATFPDGSKKTNAFPKANDVEVMEKMVTKNAEKILSAPRMVDDIVEKPAVAVAEDTKMSGGGGGANSGSLLDAIAEFIRGGAAPAPVTQGGGKTLRRRRGAASAKKRRAKTRRSKHKKLTK